MTTYFIEKRTGEGSPSDPFVRTRFIEVLDEKGVFDGTVSAAIAAMDAAAPAGTRFELIGIDY